MKRTAKDGKQIGFIKKGCTITTVSIDAAGNPTTENVDTYDDESECRYNYNDIDLPEVADLVPAAPTPAPTGPWPVQTRGEASALGQSKYYTGSNCKRGHISQRYVSSGLCIACISMRSKGFKKNRDAASAGLVPVMVRPEHLQAMKDYAEILGAP